MRVPARISMTVWPSEVVYKIPLHWNARRRTTGNPPGTRIPPAHLLIPLPFCCLRWGLTLSEVGLEVCGRKSFACARYRERVFWQGNGGQGNGDDHLRTGYVSHAAPCCADLGPTDSSSFPPVLSGSIVAPLAEHIYDDRWLSGSKKPSYL